MRVVFVLSLGLVAGLFGCGGHVVTKKDVIARADQICESAASSVRAIAPPAGGSMSALAGYYGEVTPIIEREVRALRALPHPSQDRRVLKSYLDAIASSAGEYAALVRAAQAGDVGAFAAASAALRSNPAAGLAARYGMTECGGSLGTGAS
jgi:hypothetical protein